MNEMQTHPVKQLRRTRNGRIIAGVCSGLSEYTGIDANILRIVLVVASFFGGLGLGVYGVAWLLMPEEGKATSIVQDIVDKQKAKRGLNDWQRLDEGWQRPSATPYASTGAADERPFDEPAPASAAPRTAGDEQPRTDA
ncbi:PspC domain-containing protein [Thermopolyspora sp. NPDC052614]|uniref:PspC domain-containing protein n=1 Tax=Thermopolyspora sp. NPDC052614 TaxID=3155682 RepID=UPI003447D938